MYRIMGIPFSMNKPGFIRFSSIILGFVNTVEKNKDVNAKYTVGKDSIVRKAGTRYPHFSETFVRYKEERITPAAVQRLLTAKNLTASNKAGLSQDVHNTD